MESQRVVLLNFDYTFNTYVSWQKAVCLIHRGKAEVVKKTDLIIRSVDSSKNMIMPKVIRLLKIIRELYRNKVPFKSQNIFIRDRFTCQYCGKSDGKMTVDHVRPLSMGGKNNFENCVTACNDCNQRKANRTPTHAHMFLTRQPYAPTIMEFIMLRMKDIGIKDFLKELSE